MRTVNWDDPQLCFDNPNLRWGNPAYLLEPGDPGYVGPVPAVSEPKTKKRMKRDKFYPTRQGDQVAWLANFRDKITGYAATLGLTAGQASAAVADCGWLEYVLGHWLPDVRAWTKACTDAAAAAETGSGADPLALPVFSAPPLPTGVVAVAPGALSRIFALVKIIKNGGKCTDAIATDLGILGAEATPPDLSAVQPVLKLSISGSEVRVGWGWNGAGDYLSSCEILVDRSDGKGFVPLTIDTTPNYNDTQPFPAAKAIWTYKAIYRAEDAQVGRWSQPVSVTVGG